MFSCQKKNEYKPLPLPTNDTLHFTLPTKDVKIADTSIRNLYLDTTGAAIGNTIIVSCGNHSVQGIYAKDTGIIVYYVFLTANTNPTKITIDYRGVEFGHYSFRVTY